METNDLEVLEDDSQDSQSSNNDEESLSSSSDEDDPEAKQLNPNNKTLGPMVE